MPMLDLVAWLLRCAAHLACLKQKVPGTWRALCVVVCVWCVLLARVHTTMHFEGGKRHHRRSSPIRSTCPTQTRPKPRTHAHHTLHAHGQEAEVQLVVVVVVARLGVLAFSSCLPHTTAQELLRSLLALQRQHKARDSSTPHPKQTTSNNHGFLYGRYRGHCPRALAHPKPPTPGGLPLLSRQQEVDFHLPLRDSLLLVGLGLA